MIDEAILLDAQIIIYKARKDNKPDTTIEIQRALNGLTHAKESGCEASVDFAIELIESEIEDYRELNNVETS